MHTQQLSINQQDHSHEVERSEEAAIVGEIARHFLDLREATSAYRASLLITKLHCLGQVHPEALWLVLSLLTGDLSEITRSYSDMGKEHAKSKQAVEQERSRAMEGISRHFPHLAKAVIELRHITAQIGPKKFTVEITREL
jgi:predicted component of type VI protein secretion system